jgi:hypothetical protein
MDIKIPAAKFDGFGPITTSHTTFAQGIGRGGSFAPIWTDRISQRPRAIYEPNQEQASSIIHPFQLTVVNTVVNNVNISKVRIQYGEIDGIAPNGLILDGDYLLEPGNSFIYLIVTFDGNGRINSRTIGFGNPVPDDTDDQKHIVIGEVEYTAGVYKIINQNITQDIYPEKALVVDRSNSQFVYSLFADPRKINAIYELENFNVNLDGENLTTRLYLKSEDNAEYLELKKDSEAGECSIYGYGGNNAQNFLVSANDTTRKSRIALYDEGASNFYTSILDSDNKVQVMGYSDLGQHHFLTEANSIDGHSKSVLFDLGVVNYLESKIDTDSKKTSVYGYSGNNAQNFVLSSDDTANKSKLELHDSNSANFFTSIIDSTSKVSVRGYSNNEEQQFLIEANSVDGVSKSTLFDSGSANYLECKVDTDAKKTSVYGYAENNNQNFILSSDNIADKSTLALFDSGSVNYVEIKEANDVASVYGYMNNQNHNFALKAQAGKSQLELFNKDSDAYVNLKQQNSEASLYAYVDNEDEYFILKAKAEDTQLYLGSGDNYVKIDIPDNDGTLLNAFWQEIDICVDGVAKKMKVLGTAPYDPPA